MEAVYVPAPFETPYGPFLALHKAFLRERRKQKHLEATAVPTPPEKLPVTVPEAIAEWSRREHHLHAVGYGFADLEAVEGGAQ